MELYTIGLGVVVVVVVVVVDGVVVDVVLGLFDDVSGDSSVSES